MRARAGSVGGPLRHRRLTLKEEIMDTCNNRVCIFVEMVDIDAEQKERYEEFVEYLKTEGSRHSEYEDFFGMQPAHSEYDDNDISVNYEDYASGQIDLDYVTEGEPDIEGMGRLSAIIGAEMKLFYECQDSGLAGIANIKKGVIVKDVYLNFYQDKPEENDNVQETV